VLETIKENNMKRKIIKQGHNTLTITLPAEWTKRLNIEAGKEVDIEERDNGLFISTEKNGKKKHAEFNIEGMDIPTIWKYFMAVYREGCDEVVVRFNPKMEFESPYKFHSQHRLDLKYKKTREKITVLEAMQNFVNRFIDFEIVEHGKDYVVIKEMGELTSKEFDNSLRRIFLLIQQMTEETLEAIKTNNPKLLSHTHDVDINLDKFHDYCIRILNRVSNKEPRKTALLFSILYMLELIGDEYKTISHHLLYDFSPKTSLKNIEYLAEVTKKQIDTFYDLYYKFDSKKIASLSEIDKSLYLTVNNIYKKASEDEKEVYHHLRIIGRYINALTELRIEMEF
jgi:phosphate uptake regulator